jgi:hypothetical protein
LRLTPLFNRRPKRPLARRVDREIFQHEGVVNHVLSMGLLVICVILFLLAAKFVTSTFFLLMVTITTISYRRG